MQSQPNDHPRPLEGVRILEMGQLLAGPFAADVEIGDGETVKLPTFVPKLSETPGRTEWIGPSLGARNREIYGGLLGMSDAEIARLQADGVI